MFLSFAFYQKTYARYNLMTFTEIQSAIYKLSTLGQKRKSAFLLNACKSHGQLQQNYFLYNIEFKGQDNPEIWGVSVLCEKTNINYRKNSLP